MMTAVIDRKTTVTIAGRRTTMRLSPSELRAMDAICAAIGLSRHEFCTQALANAEAEDITNTQKVRDAITEFLMHIWEQSTKLGPSAQKR